MANNKESLLHFDFGMTTDLHPLRKREGFYDYMLNGTIDNFDGSGDFIVQNEQSNIFCTGFPENYEVAGYINVIEQNRIIWFLFNPITGASEIGETQHFQNCKEEGQDYLYKGLCDNCDTVNMSERKPLETINSVPCCTYSTIKNQDCFNFSLKYPVKHIVYEILSCSLKIFFTDYNNDRRYLEFDYVDNDPAKGLVIQKKFFEIIGFEDEPCQIPIYGTNIDCNKLKVQPSFAIPCIEFIDLVPGGSNKAGVYQFFISYSSSLGEKRSSYFSSTNIIPIKTKDITVETDYVTDRAIQLEIKNLDLYGPFDHYTLVVAKTINSNTAFYIAGTFPITQTKVTYTGNNLAEIKVDVFDIFQKLPYHPKAKTVTLSNNILYWSGLKDKRKLNLQQVANKIKLYWQTIAIPESVYNNPRNANKFVSYLRDEVYPFGIEFIRSGQGETSAFHIPGRAAIASDIEVIDNDDVIEEDNCATAQENCCEDPATIEGSVTWSCSDNGCTEQGASSLQFTFPVPTPFQLNLQIGFIENYPLVGEMKAVGYDIFTLPPGVTPSVYYANANLPVNVVIPAGTTSITIPAPILVGSQHWVCHSCIFPVTDLYIKSVPAGNLTTTFSTEQEGITIHNIENIQSPDDCVECVGTRNLRWQVYNTANILGGNLELYKDCEETCYQYGEFAYWESIDKYPNIPEVWGPLCGQPIRHHKFPDSIITHIHDRENSNIAASGGTYFEDNIVYPIGVKVDHDSVRQALTDAVDDGLITVEEYNEIIGYKIVRGNRFGHKSIEAKGLFFDVNEYVRKNGSSAIDQKPIYFANYPYNDLRDNIFITDQQKNYDHHNSPEGADLPFTLSKRYTFHSPNTHYNQPNPGTEIKLETVEYGEAEGYYAKSRKQAKQRLLSDASYVLAITGGLVAALLRTEEKQESTYTIRGVDLSALGVASGTYGPTTIPPIGPQAIWYDTITGFPLPAVPPMSTIEKKTIQGTRDQYFNGLITIKEPALAPLGTFLNILTKIPDFIRVMLDEINIILKLIEALTPYRDWTVQYHSVGKYNNYVSVPNNQGIKRRVLNNFSYLEPGNKLISEQVGPTSFSSIKFNNWNRESSLYLKYDGSDFRTPDQVSGVVDQSRIAMDNPTYYPCDCGSSGNSDCALDKRIYTPISSFYGSLKNFVPDQYGNIYEIEYLSTDSCIFDMNASNNDCRGVYGGDTYIGRFGLKIKVPYFLATTFQLPAGTDFNYSEYPNLAFPRNYYNNTLTLASEVDSILDLLNPANFPTLLGRPKSIRDCSTNKFFYQNGYIYLYHYGIPYFMVESDINVDLRHGENSKEKDFYPHQSDLDFWLQEENVPIREDNYYFYNRDYSKQNKESIIVVDGPNDILQSSGCTDTQPNDIIYATDKDRLIYKENDKWTVPLSEGIIVSLDAIENDTVLIRTTNSMSIFKSILRLDVQGQTAQVGNGGIFSNPPQQFARTTLGYLGTQNRAILNTEHGHIFVDAKRGEIFNISSGAGSLDEISNKGHKTWFANNLPFRILKDFNNFPEADIDNNFLGLGIILSYDKKRDRIFVTKLDYKVSDKDVKYDPVTKDFYKIVNSARTIISLDDETYFENISWTIAYSFLTKSWIGYYSFKPNYYIDNIEFFGSGIHNEGFWLHNLTNASYQVFYGKLYPFIVEPIRKYDTQLDELINIEFNTEVKRYENQFDYLLKKKIPGFNKAIIYNDIYNSGLLNLIQVNKQDFSAPIYPIVNMDSWDIEIAQANFKWRINQFYNLVRDDSEAPLWLFKGNNVDKILNGKIISYNKDQYTLARLKGQWFKTRFINDKWSNYKILFTFSSEKELTHKR